MARDVVLPVSSGAFAGWAKKFVARQPAARTNRPIVAKPTLDVAKRAIIDAISTAGTGGRLIFNVGHGSTSLNGNAAEGTCEIAPDGAFKLTGLNNDSGTVSVFYDVKRNAQSLSDLEHDLKNNPGSQRLKNWRVYSDIAAAAKRVRLRRIIFLTCKVGNSTEFLRKLANDWGTVVEAYTKQVACTEITVTAPRKPPLHQFYLHLAGENVPFASAEANVVAQEEIPFRPAESVRVGPPL